MSDEDFRSLVFLHQRKITLLARPTPVAGNVPSSSPVNPSSVASIIVGGEGNPLIRLAISHVTPTHTVHSLTSQQYVIFCLT